MAQGFYDLRKDIQLFLARFDKYIDEKGAELKEQAKELKATIEGLQATIEEWVLSFRPPPNVR